MSQNTSPRVLYVDDEAINQYIAEEILTALGAEVDTASDGLQALRLVRTGHYALVVTDVEMPLMDGPTFTHILRQDTRYEKLPILACTAISTREEEESLLGRGFDAVIRKPFDSDTLREALAGYAAPAKSLPPPKEAPAPPVPPVEAPGEASLRIPGFSVREGLARIMGNLPLYVSLLLDFRRELAKASGDIRRFRQNADMPSIHAVVHKLKGISGNVGATELYSSIVDMEPRLHEADPATAEKLLDTLEGYVTTTLAALSEVEKTLVATEPPRAGQLSPAGEAPDLHRLRPALSKTLEFVRQHDTAARDALDAARPFLGEYGKAEVFDIQQSLDSFDFDKAESSLLHLARTLELELEDPHALS